MIKIKKQQNNLLGFATTIVGVIFSFINDCLDRLMTKNYKDRSRYLAFSAVMGVFFSIVFYYCSWIVEPRLNISLILLFLSLPTIFLLWLYRTYDTREQIQKNQDNIDQSSYLKALDLILEGFLKNNSKGTDQNANR